MINDDRLLDEPELEFEDKPLITEDDLDTGDEAEADAEIEADEDVDLAEIETVAAPAESRANRRIRALAEEAKAARAQAESAHADIRRMRQEADAAGAQMRASQERQMEEERVSLLEPDEQIKYRMDKFQAMQEAQMRAMEARLTDKQDQVTFLTEMGSRDIAKPYLEKVEKQLQELRASGVNANRKVILEHLIGKEFLENGQKAAAAQLRKATLAVNKQKVPARNLGSDVGSSRRASGESFDQRAQRIADYEF